MDYVYEITIDGVTIKYGDEVEVRLTPGSPWVRRKFLEANRLRTHLWCIQSIIEGSDAAYWNGAFDVKWCVRLPNILDVIVKKISEP